jgi:hypothetical protein
MTALVLCHLPAVVTEDESSVEHTIEVLSEADSDCQTVQVTA